MTATGQHTSVAHRLALRALLALLVAVTGLACAQAASATESAQLRNAASSVPADPSHAQSRTAGDDAYATHPDTAASQNSCSGKDDQHTEAPAPTRHEAPAPTPFAGPGASPAQGDGGARVVPGRGSPAPPPSPPSLEALSVLRV